MKIGYLLFALLLLICMGCNKDSQEMSVSDLLTDKIWLHDYDMVDFNENMKPDDSKGEQRNTSFDFRNDGSLVFTNENVAHQLQWSLLDEDTTIKIIGVMDSMIIPLIEESNHSIFLINEDNLIFYITSTVAHPEIGSFMIYKHE